VVEYNIPSLGADKSISICPGTSYNLAALFNTSGLTTYWWHDGTAIANATAVTDAGTYQLVAANGGGCSDTALVTVTVKPDFKIGTDTTLHICTGNTVDISQLYPTGGFTTEWKRNGLLIAPPVAESSTALYQLVVLNGFSCTDTVLINLAVHNNPTLGNDKMQPVCAGTPVDLTQQFATAGLTQSWYLDGVSVTNPSSILNAPGSYQLVATDVFGCADTAMFTITPAFKPNLGADKTVTVCNAVAFNLNSLFSLAGLTPSWSLSGMLVTNPTTVTTPGIYRLIATGGIGCADTAFVTLNQIPALDLGPD
jgi:hypothetical protein